MRSWMSSRALIIGTAARSPGWAGKCVPRSMQTDQAVPSDLRPLLQPRRSELRLVITRYNADRALLATNFPGGSLGGGRGGRGGRGGAAANAEAGQGEGAAAQNRVADRDLDQPDRAPQALRPFLADRTRPGSMQRSYRRKRARDLSDLNATIQSNLRQLDAQAAVLSEVMPLLPFAPDLFRLLEDRIAIRDMDAERAAATLIGPDEAAG